MVGIPHHANPRQIGRPCWTLRREGQLEPCRGCGRDHASGWVYAGPGRLSHPYLCRACWRQGGAAVRITGYVP